MPFWIFKEVKRISPVPPASGNHPHSSFIYLPARHSGRHLFHITFNIFYLADLPYPQYAPRLSCEVPILCSLFSHRGRPLLIAKLYRRGQENLYRTNNHQYQFEITASINLLKSIVNQQIIQILIFF